MASPTLRCKHAPKYDCDGLCDAHGCISARPADATPQPARPTDIAASEPRYRVVQASETGRWWLWKYTPRPELGGGEWDTLGEVSEVIPAAASLASSPSAETVSGQEQDHLSKTENDQLESSASRDAPSRRDWCGRCCGRGVVSVGTMSIACSDCSGTGTMRPERALVLAVDFSRSSPNEFAPAAALTPPLIGEAPLASAPREEQQETRDADAREEELTRYDRLRLLSVLRFDGDALHYFSRQDAALLDQLLREHHDAESSLQSERLVRETAERERQFLRVMVEDFALVEMHDERRGAPPTDIYRMPYSSSWFPTRAAAVDDFLARALAAPHPETRP